MRGISISLIIIGSAASALLALGYPEPVRAQFGDDQKQISQCILNYTGDTRSSLAVVKIRNACNDLYRSNSLASDSERNYDQCLLGHIAGAQTDFAAQQISSACRNANSSF